MAMPEILFLVCIWSAVAIKKLAYLSQFLELLTAEANTYMLSSHLY